MRITKFVHACVRIEHEGRVLVIDPGIWSEPHALFGADAVLVTHAHSDHVDRLRLAGLGATVYAPAGAEIPGVEATPVEVGEEFSAAGFTVTAHGGRHATVHGDEPAVANLGYLVDGEVYHPGDALHVPAAPVRTLLVPAQASWLKTAEAIDFIAAVGPERAFAIHDAQVNERGLEGIDHWLSRATPGYRRLRPGESA